MTGHETVRWYTRARKFPKVVGRLANGQPIPFGPYTLTELVGGGVAVMVMSNTTGLWGQFGFFGNLVVFVCVVGGVVYGLRQIPIGTRSPLELVSGIVRALAAPSQGEVAEYKKPKRRPRPARSRCLVITNQAPATSSVPEPARAAESIGLADLFPEPDPVPPAPALTGVQQLLALTCTTTPERNPR